MESKKSKLIIFESTFSIQICNSMFSMFMIKLVTTLKGYEVVTQTCMKSATIIKKLYESN